VSRFLFFGYLSGLSSIANTICYSLSLNVNRMSTSPIPRGRNLNLEKRSFLFVILSTSCWNDLTRKGMPQTLEGRLNEARQRLSLLQVDKSQVDSDRRDAANSKVEIECLIDDLEVSSRRASSRKTELKKMLERVQETIVEKEKELSKVIPEWENATRQEQETREQLEEKKAQVDVLYAKQGRTTQFKTKKERDDYLNAEISTLESLLQTRTDSVESLRREVAVGKASLEDVKTKLVETRHTLDEKRDLTVKLSQEQQDLVRERDVLQEQRK
jgi:structural maintenance of chromosome 3 (chondroitin sulfate proteoglycan 6)